MNHFERPVDPRVRSPVPERHAADRSRLASHFFLLTLGVFAASFCLAWMLAHLFGRSPHASAWTMVLHPAFAISSLLLLRGSYCLSKALWFVRQERQGEFRHYLMHGLRAGSLFTAFQSYALWAISPFERGASAASLGVRPFIILLCTLHALHFMIAVMGLVYVTVQANADKYDHEYHWGVTVCTSVWHFLGVAWVGVLAVIVISL